MERQLVNKMITPPNLPTASAVNDGASLRPRCRYYERRAAGQRAEQQGHPDFLVRLTKKQEERENREARKRFAESQRRKWGGSKPE
jgi:hypothetical protein